MGRKPTTKAAPKAPVSSDATGTESALARTRSLVFISHDTRDAMLAELFANLLTDVSAGTLKSFRSSDKKGVAGIEFGAEWYAAIMSQLGNATDVVALLTPHSLDRPWILYEAGVAKGKLDTVVFGVALGVGLEKVSTGPFGQFQNCGDDEDSLTKLVMQLLGRNPDASPREEAVRMQVQLFMAKVAEHLASNSSGEEKSEPEEESIAKLFEEVKAMVREMPDRLENRIRHAPASTPLRRLSRRSPMIVEDILFSSRFHGNGRDSMAMSWLMLVSLLRDDLPWLHEVGLDIYRQYKLGKDISKSADEFGQLADMTFRGPLGEVFGGREKFGHDGFRHLPEMSRHFLMQMMEAKPLRKSTIPSA